MSANTSSAAMEAHGFQQLPIEITQKIGAHLDDKTLVSFRLACKHAYNAVEGDAGALWRRRFHDAFETSGLVLTGQRKVDCAKFKDQYQQRKRVLHVIDPVFQRDGKVKPKLKFDVGRRALEKPALKVLRDLIVEAFSDRDTTNATEYTSKNLALLTAFTERTNILQILGRDTTTLPSTHRPRDLRDPSTTLLHTIQVVLAPAALTFSPWHRDCDTNYPAAQRLAYADNETCPILHGPTGQTVNMAWLLANLQFWRHQFLTESEPMSPHFEALEPHDRPAFWSSQLSSHNAGEPQQVLAPHWKGSYAYVDRGAEIDDIRAGRNGDDGDWIQDKLNGEDDPDSPFQSLDLALVTPDTPCGAWNPTFEHHLKSLKTPSNKARTRAQHNGSSSSHPSTAHSTSNPLSAFTTSATRFLGSGTDDVEDFHIDGHLNPLPPQSGIPGFQRVTMMKYFLEHGAIDYEALWAYEGIVLPGGKVMVGRWWCPSDGLGGRMYSGPFVLWGVGCVDADGDGEGGCGCGEEEGEDGGEE